MDAIWLYFFIGILFLGLIYSFFKLKEADEQLQRWNPSHRKG